MKHRLLPSFTALLALAAGSAAFAQQIDNPQYTQWAKYKVGTYTTMKQSTSMAQPPAGMPAGMDMAAMMPQTSITTKLTEVKPDALTLEITTTTTQMGRSSDNKITRTILAKIDPPATMPSTAPATQSSVDLKDLKEGKETLDINGKKIDAVTREYDTTINTAGTQAVSHIKSWTSSEIPGAMVKTESTTTIQQMGEMKTTMMLTDFNVVK